MKRVSFQYLARALALALAFGVGSYIVLCRGASPRTPAEADSNGAHPSESQNPNPAPTAVDEDAQPRESCESLALEIRQFDIFMTTSKSGPSPADLERLDAMRERYQRHCE